MTDTPDYLTKADLQVLLTAQAQEFEAKMTARDEQFKKELDIQSNKIHSSYAKKLKASPETEETPETSSRKATKRELELEEIVKKTNESVAELMKRDDEKTAELKAAKEREVVLAHKNNFTNELVKQGFQPSQIETIYKLQQFDNAFVEDGKGGLNWKVKANGVDVALPMAEAAKHFTKSELAEQFLPGKTNGGGTKQSIATNPNAKDQGKRERPVVDWMSVTNDMHGGGSNEEAGFAPPFDTGKRY